MFCTQIRPLEHARNCFHVPWRGAKHVSERVDASKVGKSGKDGIISKRLPQEHECVVRKECVINLEARQRRHLSAPSRHT
jgi:hypothetical protein